MVRFNITFVASFFLLTLTGCSNSVEPIIAKAKDPGSFTWSIDTLYYTPSPQFPGQTVIFQSWGLHDSLIYAVGYDSFNGRGSMWKYGGNGWERIKLLATEGGPFSDGLELFAITGYSPNNVYAFGYSFSNFTGSFINTALVIHFDGAQWKKIEIPKGDKISSVVSLSPSLIYCGGDNGQLYNFDGTKWTVDTIKQTPYPSIKMQVSVVGMSSDQGVYIRSAQYNPSTGFYYQFLKYKDKHIEIIDSGTNSLPWGGYSYWQNKNGTLYSAGEGGIYRLIDNKFQKYYSDTAINSIVGEENEPVFAIKDKNVIYHDGPNWRTVYTIAFTSKLNATSMYYSGHELFVFYSDGSRSYVLHGE